VTDPTSESVAEERRERRLTPPNHYRLRQRRRYEPRAFLSREQVRAAYTIYCGGPLSLQEIADLGWEKWGYANPQSAFVALYQAFRREGYGLRDPAVGTRLRWQKYRAQKVGA
jgi:hypothetical protein